MLLRFIRPLTSMLRAVTKVAVTLRCNGDRGPVFPTRGNRRPDSGYEFPLRIVVAPRALTGALAFIVALWLSTSIAWAQDAVPVEESKEAWVVSYALVILCVALGIFIITRPGGRDKGT